MRLFVYEFRKIFRQKSLLGIFAVSILLNLVFLNVSERDKNWYTPGMYMDLQEDLALLSDQEAYEKLLKSEQVLENKLYWQEEESDAADRELCPYTGDEWTELELIKDELDEREKVLDYADYLQGIREDADNMLEVSIFQQSSGFSGKNVRKTAEDFVKMETVTPHFDVSRGVTMAVGFLPTDFLAVFLLFAVCVFLILNEKQQGSFALICNTAKGRRETLLAKLSVLAVSVCVIFGVMYAGNFVSAGCLYGFGDPGRALQSVGDYQSSILPITVGQYFLLFAGMKMLQYLLIGMILFLICMWFRQFVGIFLAVLGILGGSIALYYFVPENGTGFTLKYLNLFYFLRTDCLLTRYKNINLFGQPVGILAAAVIVSVILIVVLIPLNIHAINGSHILWNGKGSGLPGRKQRVKLPGGCTLSGFEYLKIMRKTGGVLVLLAFVVIQCLRVRDYSFFQDADEVYYRTYMEYLAGPVTEQTHAYMKEENARYESLLSRDTSQLTEEEQNQLRQDLLPYAAWMKVNEEYERILTLNETGDRELFLVYDGGYRELLGDNTVMDMTAVCLLGILLGLCFAPTFSGDSSVGMDLLIKTTARGRRDTLRAKQGMTFVWAAVFFFLVYGADFLKVFLKAGLTAPDSPVQSLRILGNVGIHMTVWQYLLCMYLIRFFGMIVMLHVIWILSRWCQDTFRAMLIHGILFVMPAALGMIGITMIENMTLLPLLTGNVLLNALLAEGNISYFVIYFAIGIVLTAGIELILRYRIEDLRG